MAIGLLPCPHDKTLAMTRVAFVIAALTAAAATPVRVSPSGPLRRAPLYGVGNEFIFQSTADAGLNDELLASSSRVSRFPGGTPADYWDWRRSWMATPTGAGCGGCDSIPERPTSPSALAAYASSTHQEIVYVVNQLTSNLSEQLAGLHAFVDAGGALRRIELGNEMYDATRADVLAVYPTPEDYGVKMATWTSAIKAAFPNTTIAWVGVANDWDNRTRAWNGGVFPHAGLADAATVHLYPGLPNVNITTSPSTYAPFLAPLFPLLPTFASYTNTSIPAHLSLWVTEWGTWGNDAALNTWLQGLWHATFALVLVTETLPRLDVLTPYCAVCGDPAMPSFTTDTWGPVVPPNTTVPAGGWRRTASGHAYALAAAVLAPPAPAVAIQALAFDPNPVLDSAVPASRTLVGARAVSVDGRTVALTAINLGSAPIVLDVTTGVPPFGDVCGGGAAPCVSVYYPTAVTDAARRGIRVEELGHASGPLGANGTVTLPPYGVGVVACACAGDGPAAQRLAVVDI